MPDSWWLEFGAIAVAHGLAVASPGPDFALVLRQSLRHGRAVATATACGIGSGILVHVTYSLLGVALVLRSSPAVFAAVKYAGAGYLLWLAWGALRSSGPAGGDASVRLSPGEREVDHNPWMRGFLTNVLNPKATLFFLALFTVVVNPGTPKLVQAAYGLGMAGATAVWFTFVGLVFTQPRVRAAFLRKGVWIDRLLGVVFVGFALSLIWS